jgi:hypothetical protein
VTTVDLVLWSSSIFDFSLQNSLTSPTTTFGSAVITTPTARVNTEAIAVNTMLPAGTYYLVGTKDPTSNTPVPGWFLSNGTYVTKASVYRSSAAPTVLQRAPLLNNKAKVTMRKSYGFRTYRILELALYHSLGKLPEPESTHDFF